MALALRAASGGNQGATTATSQAITWPAGTAANDIMYFVVSVGAVVSNPVCAGWTLSTQNTGATPASSAIIGYRTLEAGDTAPTVTWTGAGKVAWSAISLSPSAGNQAIHNAFATPLVGTTTATARTPPNITAPVTAMASVVLEAHRASGTAATAVTTTPSTNWIEPTNGDNSTATGTTTATRQVAAEIFYRVGLNTGGVNPSNHAVAPTSYSIINHALITEQPIPVVVNPKLSELVYNFTDNTLPAALDDRGNVTANDGDLVLSAVSGAGTQYSWFGSNTSISREFDSIFIGPIKALPVAAGGEAAQFNVRSRALPASTRVGIEYRPGVGGQNWLCAYNQTDYYDATADPVAGGQFAIPFNANNHRYWRMQSTGTTVNWQVSPDGSTWTTIRTATISWAANVDHTFTLEAYRTGGVTDEFRIGAINAVEAFAEAVTDSGLVASSSDGEGTGSGSHASYGDPLSATSSVDNSEPYTAAHTGLGATTSTTSGEGTSGSSVGSSGATTSETSGSGVSFPGAFGTGSTESFTDGTATAAHAGTGLGSSESYSDGLGLSGPSWTGSGSLDVYSDGSGLGKIAQVGEIVVQYDGIGTSTSAHYTSGETSSSADGIAQPSGQHVSPGEQITSGSSSTATHSGQHKAVGTPVTVSSTTDGTGSSQQLGSAGITRPIVGMAIRIIGLDGLPGAFLPDWTEIGFTDQYNAGGTVTISYAKTGVNAHLLKGKRVEGALYDGTLEIPNTRFLVTQSSTDGVKEDSTGNTLIINAPLYVHTRLEEATIYPPLGPATFGQPQQPTGIEFAAQEILNRIKSGGSYFEDYTYYGCSANLSAYNDQLVDLFYRRNPGWDWGADWEATKAKDIEFLESIVDKTDSKGINTKTYFSNCSPGEVIGRLLRQAKVRGAVSDVVQNFSATQTTGGVPWTQNVTMEVEAGGTILSVLNKLVEMGVCDYTCDGRELKLHNYDSGADLTTGLNPVVLQAGRDLLDAPEKRDTGRAMTACLVIGKDGISIEVVDTAEEVRQGSRIEGFVSVSGVEDYGTMRVIGEKTIERARISTESLSHELSLFAENGPQPWVDYRCGNYILRDIGDGTGPQRYRVAQLSGTYSNTGTVTGQVTLGTRFESTAQKLQAQLDALTNGSEATSAPATQPTDDLVAPNTPSGLIANSYAYEAQDGGTLAAISASWSPVLLNEDGSNASDLEGYELRWKRADFNRYDPSVGAGLPDVVYEADITNAKWLQLLDAGWSIRPLNNSRVIVRPHGDINGWDMYGPIRDTSYTFSALTPGVIYYVQVRATDRNGNASAWSPTYKVLTENDDAAPPVPTLPVITSHLGQLRIVWNGRGQ